jgi:hypothetical protein
MTRPSFAVWRRVALVAALAAAYAAPTPTQAATEAERLQAVEKKLEQSQQLIEALQRRLAELEGRAQAVAKPVAPSAAADSSAAPRIEALERQVADLGTSLSTARAGDGGVPLHGFLDMNLVGHSSPAPAGTRNGLKHGVFDLYLTPQLGPQVRTLLEAAFEYGADGAVAVDLERAQIGYQFSDALTLWAGRFHTPFGYWNTAFHHGAQIQTAVNRPRFLAFEDQGGILPAHSVGLWATGKTETAAGKLGYDAYVANGNSIDGGVLDFNALGDDNGSPSLGFNLSLSPASVRGLTLGVHGMHQKLSGGSNADASRSGDSRLSFLGGWAFFENDDWEVIGEYYRFSNSNLDAASPAGTFGSWAGYVQAGYGVAPGWTVYGRAEKARLNNTGDNYFALQASGTSYDQFTAGVRYELDARAALKLQAERNRDAANGMQGVTWMRAQYAVRF